VGRHVTGPGPTRPGSHVADPARRRRAGPPVAGAEARAAGRRLWDRPHAAEGRGAAREAVLVQVVGCGLWPGGLSAGPRAFRAAQLLARTWLGPHGTARPRRAVAVSVGPREDGPVRVTVRSESRLSPSPKVFQPMRPARPGNPRIRHRRGRRAGQPGLDSTNPARPAYARRIQAVIPCALDHTDSALVAARSGPLCAPAVDRLRERTHRLTRMDAALDFRVPSSSALAPPKYRFSTLVHRVQRKNRNLRVLKVTENLLHDNIGNQLQECYQHNPPTVGGQP
jgi:hypothetical protein